MADIQELLTQAYQAYYAGNYCEALSLYYKILADDMNNSVNYYNVGLLYDTFREFELAVSYYKKSIRIDGSNIRSMNNLARIYIDEIKDYNIAQTYLDRAIEIAPQDAEAYNLYGNISLLKNDYSIALEYFKKAIFLDPNYFKNYYDIAVAYYATGNTEEAIANVNKSIELNPNFDKAKELLQKLK